MKVITEIGELKGKRVLVRVDWNVPLKDGKVVNDFRIKESFPTIEHLLTRGARVVLATHLEGGETSVLEPFVPKGATLLPNLREDLGEEANSEKFAKELATKADLYVNEAFSVSHREHASIVLLPKLLPSFAGLRFAKEVNALSKAFYPKHPFLFVLGGAKFDTKLPLLKKFDNIADHIFVGGALANNFFKEMGQDVGNSLVKSGEFGLGELLQSEKIILPEDTITVDGKILDVGPVSIEKLGKLVASANLILWNGPLGNYENGYKVATHALAKLVAESGRESIVGGGDTLASIEELHLLNKFSFVSTGGGAMLEFLATGTLPGIEALN